MPMPFAEAVVPKALIGLLLQATAGSFILLWFMPAEAGRYFYSTIGKALFPIAWVVTLIAYGLRSYLSPLSLIAIAVVAISLTVYTYGILSDNPIFNTLPHFIGTFAGLIAIWETAEPGWLSRLHSFSGAFLSGTAVVGMIFGHWFIVRPRMSLSPLIRTIHALFLLLALNGLLTFLAFLSSRQGFAEVLGSARPFFWGHLALGLFAPLPLNGIALYCAKERSTQAATGFLYLAMVCVLGGEVCRNLVTVATGVPL